MARLVELVDERKDHRQALVLKPHAVVKVADERDARFVDVVEQVAAGVAVRLDQALLDPAVEDVGFEPPHALDELSFANHDCSPRFCLGFCGCFASQSAMKAASSSSGLSGGTMESSMKW